MVVFSPFIATRRQRGVVASTYVGVGDNGGNTGTASAWYSVARAYKAAYASGGGNAIDIYDQAGANLLVVAFLPTGYIDLASISAWVTAHSVSTIKIAKVYDQVGTNHMMQATNTNRPTLVLSSINSLPALSYIGASTQYMTSTSPVTQTQPLTIAGVMWRPTNVTTASGFFGSSSTGAALIAFGGANFWTALGGGSISGAATDANYHSGIAVWQGASTSLLNVDGGTDTTGSLTGAWSAETIRLGRANGIGDGLVTEVGWFPSALDATNRGLITTNMHGTNGYNF